MFEYSNMNFIDITFASRGYLLELDHQLPTNLTIFHSSFRNIRQGNINIASLNLKNSALLTNVYMLNVTVDNVQEDSQSFINVEEGGRLFIEDSSFENMYIYSDGGVISGGSKGTVTTITNSLFQRNSAKNGGIFDVKEESVIKCFSCNITQNFGVASGVVNTAQNGYFEFYDSNIFKNYANNNPISKLFDSATLSIISNCKIYQNEALSKSQIITEFTSACSFLCFVNQEFKDYSVLNFGLIMTKIEAQPIFQLISASLSIIDGTLIYDQSSIINSFISTVTLQNITLTNITMSEISIKAVVSAITFENIIITGLSNPTKTGFILVMLDSTLKITNMNYSDSDSTLFKARTSSVEVVNIQFKEITNTTELFSIFDCYNISLDTVSSSDSQITGEDMFMIFNSENVTLANIDIQNSKNVALRILSSTVTRISGLYMRNCTEGLYIEESTVLLFEKSTFEDNGGITQLGGGALYVKNSDVSISNSTFKENTAQVGAAIYFTCSSITLCSISLNTSNFEYNNAIVKGGAIYYDYSRPAFGSGMIYTNNTAEYGPNIASYAVKITFSNDPSSIMKISDLGSGIALEETLKLSIMDYDNQTMILNDKNQIILTAVDSTVAEVGGFNSIGLQKGTADFNNFIVEAEPGSKSIQVSASSKAIDKAKITAIFGTQISTNIIEINLRFCKPGEQIIGKSCNK